MPAAVTTMTLFQYAVKKKVIPRTSFLLSTIMTELSRRKWQMMLITQNWEEWWIHWKAMLPLSET